MGVAGGKDSPQEVKLPRFCLSTLRKVVLGRPQGLESVACAFVCAETEPRRVDTPIIPNVSHAGVQLRSRTGTAAEPACFVFAALNFA